jgi:H+-transporting ATPase
MVKFIKESKEIPRRVPPKQLTSTHQAPLFYTLNKIVKTIEIAFYLSLGIMLTGAPLARLILVLSFSVFFAGRDLLHLPLPQLQTLVFVMLVFTGQGNVYLVRERRHFWQSRPSGWLVLSSCADIVAVGLLATKGILMAAISPVLIAGLLAVVGVFLTLVDFLKVRIFRCLGIR